MKNAIIFDVDGTLWDSTHEIAESWNEITTKKYNFSLDYKGILSCVGLAMTEFAKRLFPEEMPLDERMKILEECMNYENEYLLTHPGRLFEGVRETLEELKKDYDLLLLSNCQKNYIETFLKSTGLGYLFKDKICWGDNLKPKHENMLLLAKRGHYEKAFYVGDTEGDEYETHLAGYHFAYASYGFGKAKSPEYTLKSFGDLKEIAKLEFNS